MNLREVVRVGRSGFLYRAIGISFALLLGLALGRLKVPNTSALLISAGTAICGGSAIAAVGPVVNAGEEEMAVSLGLSSYSILWRFFCFLWWAMPSISRRLNLDFGPHWPFMTPVR